MVGSKTTEKMSQRQIKTFTLVKKYECIKAYFQVFYTDKMDVVLILWFILDDNDRAGGCAPPPLDSRPRRGFTRLVPGGCPSIK